MGAFFNFNEDLSLKEFLMDISIGEHTIHGCCSQKWTFDGQSMILLLFH